MKIGMIGLGKMGGNMVRRLMKKGHSCVVYDLNKDTVESLVSEGARGASSMEEFVSLLTPPKVVWMMVPAGEITDKTIQTVSPHLQKGDILIDGGNSYFKDDVRRSKELASRGIYYVDIGTSGGVWGADRGYCLMVGGDRHVFEHIDPILKALAPGKGDVVPTEGRNASLGFSPTAPEGYLHCGPVGAGHFVKMIHNGIEYGLMQAYAEGFDIMKNAMQASLPEAHRYEFNLADIAELWRRGSVVGSWLLDLTAMALTENPGLTKYTGNVEDSGEGRWTVLAAVEEAVPADVLTASLYTRFRSRQEHTFAEKVLSAMREKFGGHVEKK